MINKESAVYSYVVDNYYNMSRDQLKDILVEALFLLGDESELVDNLADYEILILEKEDL